MDCFVASLLAMTVLKNELSMRCSRAIVATAKDVKDQSMKSQS